MIVPVQSVYDTGGVAPCGLPDLVTAIADVYGTGCAPQISIGSAIHFAATSQLALTNLLIAKHWIGDNPLGETILTEPMMQPQDGYPSVTSAPGLGISIDETTVRELASPQRGTA